MVRCDKCRNDVVTRFQVMMEEDDESFTVVEHQKYVCSLCMRKLLEEIPKIGPRTRSFMKDMDIDPDKYVRDGNINWTRSELLKMTVKDPQTGEPKLRSAFNHLKLDK